MKHRARDQAVELLAQDANVTDVARKLRLSRDTVYAWIKDPKFSAAVEDRRRELREARRAGIRRLQDLAVKQLRRVITSRNAAASMAGIKLVLDELLQPETAALSANDQPVSIRFSLEGPPDAGESGAGQ